MTVDAIILAGSTNAGRLREVSDAPSEALIPIGGRVMVDYVVAALRATPEVGRICVVGPVAELRLLYGEQEDILLAEPGISQMRSCMSGMEALQPSGRVLVATGDIPLLTREAIEDFLTLCGDRTADLYYPVVPKEASEARFPGVHRTYIQFWEGVVTGGNMFMVNPDIVQRVMQKGEELTRLRKKPLSLAMAVGPIVLLKLMRHTLTIKEAERRVCKMMGITGRVVVSQYPEVGVDVDKPSDLELVRRVLAT